MGKGSRPGRGNEDNDMEQQTYEQEGNGADGGSTNRSGTISGINTSRSNMSNSSCNSSNTPSTHIRPVALIVQSQDSPPALVLWCICNVVNAI
jgi:hypothetical protein